MSGRPYLAGMAKAPLTDREVYDRLHAALMHLSGARGETTFGESTLRAAERVLDTLQLATLCKVDGIDPLSLVPSKPEE